MTSSFSFDATKVTPDAGRIGAVPEGWYPVIGEKAELEPTSSGTGLRVAFQAGIADGPHKGAKVFHNFNTKNDSAKAVEIGHAQLSALMHAVGVLVVNDPSQLALLTQKPFFVKLKVVPAVMEPDGVTVKYQAKNEITAFRSITDEAAKAGFKGSLGVAAPKTVAPPPVTAPAAAAAPAAGGWQQPAAAQPWNATPAAAPNVNPNPAAAPAAATSVAPAAPAQTAPVADPNVGQDVVQPSWAAATPTAQGTAAPAQATTTVPPQESTAAPATAEGELPPWMR
jgi:hypothetical protein